MKIYFLGASVALTKSYTVNPEKPAGKPNKSAYPGVFEFTSYEENCQTQKDVFNAISKHAAFGNCMLKGKIQAPLIKQSRAGATKSGDSTIDLVFDHDKSNFDSVEEFLASPIDTPTGKQIQIFKDVSYTVQYSGSHGMPETPGLSCHIFMRLSHEMDAPQLKAWLTWLNLQIPKLCDGIKLNAIGTHLHLPLDNTSCQNDKLIYIAPPIIEKGIKCTAPVPRIQYMQKKLDALPIERIMRIRPEVARQQAFAKKNELRILATLPALKPKKEKVINGNVVIPFDGQAYISEGPWKVGPYWYMNLNGGDSNSYWHHEDETEYLRCWKHPDELLLMKEVLPEYHQHLLDEKAKREALPNEAGEYYLTFSDKKTSCYFRGTWNEATKKLDLDYATTITHLDHFRMQNNLEPLDFIPMWTREFMPHSNIEVDVPRRLINLYRPSPHMRKKYDKNKAPANLDKCPTIKRVILHALNCTEDAEEYKHFINWLAVIYQHRIKTTTVWVLSGVEGTGKGIITNLIGDTLGDGLEGPQHPYVIQMAGDEIADKFNGKLRNKLFVVLDEVDMSGATMKAVRRRMKGYVTEATTQYEDKYEHSFTARSYFNFLMSTNEKEPLYLSSDNRRYNIGCYQPHKIIFTAEDDDLLKQEHDDWMEFIMTRETDVAYARTILQNDALKSLVEKSRTSQEDIVHTIQTGAFMELFDMKPTAAGALSSEKGPQYIALMRREAQIILDNGKLDCVSKLSREDLLLIFEYSTGKIDMGAGKFTQLLKHKDMPLVKVRIGNETTKGVHVKWVVTKEDMKELEEYLTPAVPNLRIAK